MRTLTYATASPMPSYASRLTRRRDRGSRRLSRLAEGAMMPGARPSVAGARPSSSRHAPALGAGHRRPPAARGRRAAELAHLLRRLRQPAPQPAAPDRRRQREEPRAEVGPPQPGVRRLAVDAARRRRHHVPHAAAERRPRRRREDRPRVLAVSLHRCRPTRASAAAPTIAGSPSSATRSSWARSTATSSPSTPRAGGRCGTSPSAIRRSATR